MSLLSAFRKVPLTGVIYVSTEAEKRGFSLESRDWCNLGQGQPETGALEGSPDRITNLKVHTNGHDYAPVSGLLELRENVADYYNRRFRKNKKSKYTADNIAISGGGRLAVSRAAAALAPINLGHFLPDYTAYEELLDIFHVFTPIPILLDPKYNYKLSIDKLREEVLGRGLSALLFSNPSNPTGTVIKDERLKEFLSTARELDLSLILDEFYSHYIWGGDFKAISAAEYIEDINKEPVLIIDGLTKNWRYPGLRLSWTLGPKEIIHAISSAGSFLDGGANRPTQEAAINLLTDKYIDSEDAAIYKIFSKKREFLIGELESLGFEIDLKPEGGFYVWANLNKLPKNLQGDMNFFKACLDKKLIVVPGSFFDINPGKKRHPRPSRFENYIRFSFGPSMNVLEKSCKKLRELIK